MLTSRWGWIGAIGTLHRLHDDEIPLVALRESSAAPWNEAVPVRTAWYRMFAGFVALAWVTILIGDAVRRRDAISRGWDLRIARWMAVHRTSSLARAVGAFNDVGALPALAAGAVALSAWAWWRTHHSGTTWLTLMALFDTHLLVQTTRRVVTRARPAAGLAAATVHGWAWPSDRAAAATALAASVWVVTAATGTSTRAVRRTIAWTAATIAALVAVSQVVIGSQWTLDVLMGATIGIAVVALLAPPLLTERPEPG